MFKAFSAQTNLEGIARGAIVKNEHIGQLNIGRIKIVSKLVKIKKKNAQLEVSLNTVPPNVGEEVYTADSASLEALYYNSDCSPAVMIANRNIRIGFDPGEMTSRHMAIFGSTGSGKSYFAKELIINHMKEWYCKKKNGQIIDFTIIWRNNGAKLSNIYSALTA